MDNQEWLDSLKEGDEVAIQTYGWSSNEYSIRKIDRITPTRQIKVSNYTFDNQGRQKGKSSALDRSVYLMPVNQKVLDSIKKRNLVYSLNKIKFDNLPLDQLEQIAAIINQDS